MKKNTIYKTEDELEKMSAVKLLDYFKWLVINHDTDITARPTKEFIKGLLIKLNY